MIRGLLPALYTIVGGALLGGVWGAPLWGALAGLTLAYLLLLGRLQRVPPTAVWAGDRSRGRLHAAESARLLRCLRGMAGTLPEAVLLLDETGSITWANASAASLLGIVYKRDRGRRLVHLVRNPGLAELLEHAVPGRMQHMELQEWVHPGMVLELRVTTGSLGALIVARDVTEERRVADMRKTFVADVSHELYTPLTVFSGSLEALWNEEQDTQGPRKRLIAAMRVQLVRISRLVRDLLSLSRLEVEATARDEPVNVPDILQQLVAEVGDLSSACSHKIDLQVDAQLHYEGDPEAMRSVCSNLLQNALRYTPAGGGITLRWYECPEGVRLEVEDSGIGIEARHLPRLTERFYRVDEGRSRASGGTGLGLSIVRHALLCHDAELEIQSRPGVGSLFRCCFPARRRLRRDADAQAVSTGALSL